MGKIEHTKIHGTMLIGIAQTFYSIRGITKEKLDNYISELSADNWYPLDYLTDIFEALKNNNKDDAQLLYQAGAAFIQSWYDNGGKSMNHGSIGHMKLQDNSQGAKHVFKDYDPDLLFTKLVELDTQKGYAVIDCSVMYPIEFTKGIFYNGFIMWDDLLWLDMETQILEQRENYTYSRFIYNFKHEDSILTNKYLDEFIEKLDFETNETISQKMALELAWKLKGLKKLYSNEVLINKKTKDMLGESLQSLVKTSTQLEKANEELRQTSITDALTGLYNRRHFNDIFEQEIKRITRSKESLTLTIMDVDNFKLFNDTYGHQAGDRVLSKIGALLKELLHRAGDFSFRLGGEEFGFLISSFDLDKVQEYIEYIRKAIENLEIPHERNSVSSYVTASFGSIILKGNSSFKYEDIYNQADEALYLAKEKGRNRVIIYS